MLNIIKIIIGRYTMYANVIQDRNLYLKITTKTRKNISTRPPPQVIISKLHFFE